MSDYESKKAIRYRIPKSLTEEQQEELFWKYARYGKGNLKKEYNLEHEMSSDSGVNYSNGESEHYLDIVLKETYGTISGNFADSRNITDEEANKYLGDFKKIFPDIEKEDLRYVFYCYYNGVDAPACYDVTN